MDAKPSCSEVESGLWRYVDRELSAADRAAITGHLASCAACRALFEERVRELRLCREAFEDAPFGERFVERCMARLRSEGVLEPRARALGPWAPGWLRRRGALVAAAAALVAAAISVWALGRPRPIGVYSARGAAVVPGWCDDEGNVRFGTASAFRGVLRPGSAFRVPRDAVLVVNAELGDPPSGTRCEVSGPAVFCVDAGAPGREFRCSLHEGELSAEVAKLARGQRFSVATPHARVRVVGTKFRVAVSADETRVAVAEGIVALESANPEGSLTPWSETVLAGEGLWTVRRGEFPVREVAAASAPRGPEREPAAGPGSKEPAASPETPAGAGLPSEAFRPAPSPSGPPASGAGLDLPVEPAAPEPPRD